MIYFATLANDSSISKRSLPVIGFQIFFTFSIRFTHHTTFILSLIDCVIWTTFSELTETVVFFLLIIIFINNCHFRILRQLDVLRFLVYVARNCHTGHKITEMWSFNSQCLRLPWVWQNVYLFELHVQMEGIDIRDSFKNNIYSIRYTLMWIIFFITLKTF